MCDGSLVGTCAGSRRGTPTKTGVPAEPLYGTSHDYTAVYCFSMHVYKYKTHFYQDFLELPSYAYSRQNCHKTQKEEVCTALEQRPGRIANYDSDPV
jgi:hypothetical protein